MANVGWGNVLANVSLLASALVSETCRALLLMVYLAGTSQRSGRTNGFFFIIYCPFVRVKHMGNVMSLIYT